MATDHAPHAAEDKETEWGAAAPGMLGLQTALSVVVETMVATGRLTWREVAERMSVGARRGSAAWPATAARSRWASRPTWCWSTRTRSWTVDPSALASKSRNTPFAGRTLPAVVALTLLRGRVTARDGASRFGSANAHAAFNAPKPVGVSA